MLADVTPQMDAYSQELFGPVAVVHRAADVDEAVALANESDFGLSGSVWSDDLELAALPARLKNHRGRVFGLTIDPNRLVQIREARRADLDYLTAAFDALLQPAAGTSPAPAAVPKSKGKRRTST